MGELKYIFCSQVIYFISMCDGLQTIDWMHLDNPNCVILYHK